MHKEKEPKNLSSRESGTEKFFAGLEPILGKLLIDNESRNSVRIGRVMNRLAATLKVDEGTPVSKLRTLEDGTLEISLGAMPFRKENIENFGWGVTNANEQMLVKLSHESAHALQRQNGYEAALVSFLNGSTDIDEKFHPYLELYTFLNTTGVCNGLADADIYHEQSRTTGLLNMTTLEDMTEFLGAYLLDDEYFKYRLDHSKIPLSDDDKKKIATHIIQIIGE